MERLFHAPVARKNAMLTAKGSDFEGVGLTRVFTCVCSGMCVCLCGCLTDSVSKSEVGQHVNQSRMEQTEQEWLSNHPNHFLLHLLRFPPLSRCSVLQLCCCFSPARKCFGVEAGWGHQAGGLWDGRIDERHLARCHSYVYFFLI